MLMSFTALEASLALTWDPMTIDLLIMMTVRGSKTDEYQAVE